MFINCFCSRSPFCVSICFYEGLSLLTHGLNRPISALCVSISFYEGDSLLTHRLVCPLCVNKFLWRWFLIDKQTSTWAVLHSYYRSNLKTLQKDNFLGFLMVIWLKKTFLFVNKFLWRWFLIDTQTSSLASLHSCYKSNLKTFKKYNFLVFWW
jgi:hypothetical protein